jgi:hypothetical protein
MGGAFPESFRDQDARLDVHEAAIVTILQRVMDIIDPPALPEPPKKQIGFQVKEGKARYKTQRRLRTSASQKPKIDSFKTYVI